MRRKLINANAAARLRACSVRSLKCYVADPLDTFPKTITDQGHMKWDEHELEAWTERRFDERDNEWRNIKALVRGEKES